MSKGRLQARLGAVVRRRREAAGLSQEALADLAGLHRTYISLLERGLRNPQLTTLQALARALDMTMGELLGELE